MSVLSDGTLRRMLPQLIKEPDESLINPASVDIRIGREIMIELRHGFHKVDISRYDNEERGYLIRPGDFILAATYEHLTVPNGFAVELKLKSSLARRGWNHSLAFWFDPGWNGIGTMEIQNVTQFQVLKLWCGMRFGQIIVHTLDGLAERLYEGRYNHAAGVEAAKGGGHAGPE